VAVLVGGLEGEMGGLVGSTVESFFIEFIDAFSLVDSILILFCGVADHPDLVLLVDEVAIKYVSVGATEIKAGHGTQVSRDWQGRPGLWEGCRKDDGTCWRTG
jgi:hypothetical protein